MFNKLISKKKLYTKDFTKYILIIEFDRGLKV